MRRLFVLLLLPSALGAAGAAPLRAEIIERIIAKVNGDIITLTEFQERQVSAARSAGVTADQIGTFLRENNARLLQEAIDEILLVQKAEDAGLGLRPEWVDETIESIKKDNKIESEEQFQMALAQEGMTLDDLRANIRKSMTQRMIVQRDIEPKISVSEEQLLEEYEKKKDEDFTKPASVSLQEIFISDERGGIALAQEIVERARANEDFASLARAHSAGPTADSGGDLGELSQGTMNSELEEVAFALSVGSVSDPIRVGEGYRILKVVAKTSGSVTPFETAKDRLRNLMMASRFQDEYDAYIAEVREGADIELRVREVPLRLSGPVPTDTLFEGVDPFSMMGSGPVPGQAAGPAPSSGRLGSPVAEGDEFTTTGDTSPQRIVPGAPLDDEISTTPQASPQRIVPGAPLDDEVSTTPQAAPERVTPAGQSESKPPSE
jgi:parvulin-like peptidyl-prolyl isomerase